MERKAELLLVWMLVLFVVQQCRCAKIDFAKAKPTVKIGEHTYLISEWPKFTAPNWTQSVEVAYHYEYRPIPLWAGSKDGKICTARLAKRSPKFDLKRDKTQKPDSGLIRVRRITLGRKHEENTVIMGHIIVPIVQYLASSGGDVAKAATFQALDVSGKDVKIQVFLTADRNEYPLESENEHYIQRFTEDHPKFKNVLTEFIAGTSKQWYSSSSSDVYEVYRRWVEGFPSRFNLDGIVQYCSNSYSDGVDDYSYNKKQPISAKKKAPFNQKQKELNLGAHLVAPHLQRFYNATLALNRYYGPGAAASNFGGSTEAFTPGATKAQLLATLKQNDNKDHLQNWRHFAGKTVLLSGEHNGDLLGRTQGAALRDVKNGPTPFVPYVGADTTSPFVGKGGSYAAKQQLLATMTQINNNNNGNNRDNDQRNPRHMKQTPSSNSYNSNTLSSSINPNSYNLLRYAKAPPPYKKIAEEKTPPPYLVPLDHFRNEWMFGGGGGGGER